MNDPALAFINRSVLPATEADKPVGEAQIPPTGYKVNPEFIEIKSKRVQLVLQPSLYNEAKESAIAAGISFNELVHLALRSYLSKTE